MTNNKGINVLINGIHGKMGSEVLNAVCKDSSLNLIAGIDKLSSTKPLICCIWTIMTSEAWIEF